MLIPVLLRRPARVASDRVRGMPAGCAEVDPTDDLVNAEYVFMRAELRVVGRAILFALGRDAAPLDTPSRLQEAVMALIRSVGGRGEAVVRRSPAALLTPEYWRIVLLQVDSATRDDLLRVLRTGGQ